MKYWWFYFLMMFVFWGFIQEDKEYTPEALRAIYGSGNSSLWPTPELFDEVKSGFVDIGRLPKVNYPKDNPYSEEKEELGKLLFFDPRLSGSNQIACATCHNPELAWTDGMKMAIGNDRQMGKRNTPTILNIAYASQYFWDGRVPTLGAQVLGPIENPIEMNSHIGLSVDKIRKIKGYQSYFEAAYGSSEVTQDRIIKAITTFERGIVSSVSRFDKFISGGQENLLSDSEINGLHLFRTKAKCINCHNTPYFSDQKFHNLGLTFYGKKREDLGLYITTKNNEDVGKFKTPSLREVAETKPYMHNGLFFDLKGVVATYSVGMGREIPKESQKNDPKFPKKSPMITNLGLTEEEVNDIVAFLQTLTSYKPNFNYPILPK